MSEEAKTTKQEIGELVLRIAADATPLLAALDTIEKRIDKLKATLAGLNYATGGAVRQAINFTPGLSETVNDAIMAAAPQIAAVTKKSIDESSRKPMPPCADAASPHSRIVYEDKHITVIQTTYSFGHAKCKQSRYLVVHVPVVEVDVSKCNVF